jgi:hypothetical protein
MFWVQKLKGCIFFLKLKGSIFLSIIYTQERFNFRIQSSYWNWRLLGCIFFLKFLKLKPILRLLSWLLTKCKLDVVGFVLKLRKWWQESRDGEARRQRVVVVSLFLCDFHKLMVLISAIENLNCHVSFIGERTGTNWG